MWAGGIPTGLPRQVITARFGEWFQKERGVTASADDLQGGGLRRTASKTRVNAPKADPLQAAGAKHAASSSGDIVAARQAVRFQRVADLDAERGRVFVAPGIKLRQDATQRVASR